MNNLPAADDRVDVADGASAPELVANFSNAFLRFAPQLRTVVDALPNDILDQNTRLNVTNGLQEAARTAQAVIDSADNATRRVKSEEAVPLLTRLPPDGDELNPLPDPRLIRLSEYSGDNESRVPITTFLSKWSRICEDYDLSHTNALRLLQRHCSGRAALVLEDCEREGSDLAGVVRTFEVNFAHLTSPEACRMRLNDMKRESRESAGQLATRIRQMARAAVRDYPADRQIQEELSLSRMHFLRCLRYDIKTELNRKENMRKTNGLKEWTFFELVAQCESLETLRPSDPNRGHVKFVAGQFEGDAENMPAEKAPNHTEQATDLKELIELMKELKAQTGPSTRTQEARTYAVSPYPRNRPRSRSRDGDRPRGYDQYRSGSRDRSRDRPYGGDRYAYRGRSRSNSQGRYQRRPPSNDRYRNYRPRSRSNDRYQGRPRSRSNDRRAPP